MSDDTTTDHGLGGAYTERMQGALADKAQESQQLHERRFADARGGAIKPPLDPTGLAKLIELNTTHAKAVFSKARNVAGYGLEIVPHPEVDNPSEDELATARSFWFGRESTWQVGPTTSELATHADVLSMAWADFEAIGWLSLEALVNPTTGEPTGLAYIPAPTIRKRKDTRGFVQIKQGGLRYFGAFGDRYDWTEGGRTFVDSNTGESGQAVAGDVANEIIWKRNHTPFVDHYGTPDIVPAIPNVEGDLAARGFNIDFFEHNAVPRLAIIVEGGQLTQGARGDIRKVMHGMKDADHRTIILEVEKLLDDPGSVSLDDDSDNLRIRVEPITVGLDEDASFLDYHGHNEHEILKVHEVPPIEAGTIESGAFSTDAEAQRKSYLETTIAPKQESFAQLLHETIHRALGVEDWIIRFKQRGIDTRRMDAELADLQVRAMRLSGVATVDEVREVLDLPTMGPPLGEMTIAEFQAAVAGPGGGGAGGDVDGAIRDSVSEEFDDLAEQWQANQRVEERITRGAEADD